MIGQRFGRLVILERCKNSAAGKPRFRCECDCGNSTVVSGADLRRGHTQSCGCLHHELQADRMRQRNFKHGEALNDRRSTEYVSWLTMMRRCDNPNQAAWSRYGGRGISVCERWHSYEKFLADMGRKPTPRHTLDRIDGDGHYEPANCRWATYSEQRLNR
jgi:hypothetical protein